MAAPYSVKYANPVYQYRHKRPGSGYGWERGSGVYWDLEDAKDNLRRKYQGKEHVDITGTVDDLTGRLFTTKHKVTRAPRRKKSNPRSRWGVDTFSVGPIKSKAALTKMIKRLKAAAPPGSRLDHMADFMARNKDTVLAQPHHQRDLAEALESIGSSGNWRTSRRSRNPSGPRKVRGLRSLTHAEKAELMNLYHLARTPLGSGAKKYDRMLWASKEFAKAHDGISSTGAYKHLDRELVGWNPRRKAKNMKRNPSGYNTKPSEYRRLVRKHGVREAARIWRDTPKKRKGYRRLVREHGVKGAARIWRGSASNPRRKTRTKKQRRAAALKGWATRRKKARKGTRRKPAKRKLKKRVKKRATLRRKRKSNRRR